MSITRHSIHKHELIGLSVQIIGARDPGHMDMTGRIIDETKNTIVMESAGEERRVPKRGTVLKIELGDGSAKVDLSNLTFRPEDRIKKANRRMT